MAPYDTGLRIERRSECFLFLSKELDMKTTSCLFCAASSVLPLALAISMAVPVTSYARNISVNKSRTEDGRTRDVTRTGPNGKTVTHDGSSSYDASTKTFSRSSSTVGPNGGTTSSTGNIVKTADGTTRTTTFTGLDGQTKTGQVTRTRSSIGD
jgi:hypothetical protein